MVEQRIEASLVVGSSPILSTKFMFKRRVKIKVIKRFTYMYNNLSGNSKNIIKNSRCAEIGSQVPLRTEW